MAIGVGYKREHESNQMERIEWAPGDGALRMACDVFLLATEATKAAASRRYKHHRRVRFPMLVAVFSRDCACAVPIRFVFH
jgi:hypothetical protein